MGAADRELDIYARRCEESRLPVRRWHATLLRATRAIMAGRLADASALAMAAVAPSPEDPVSLPAQFYAAQVYLPFREAGRTEELVEPYVVLARTYAALPIWRVGLGLVHAEGGRMADARRVL